MAVLEAADPYRIVSQALQFEPGSLIIHDQHIKLAPDSKIVLIAVGKAASPMARAAKNSFPLELKQVIVARPEPDQSVLPVDWRVFQAGHPLPNEASLAAGKQVQSALSDLHPGDLIVLLLSGGGSALLELPKAGISLEDLRMVNMDLLRSGAPIEEINLVRKSLSRLKAGGLARMASPANVLTLILSDVVGDDLSVVASGPTASEQVDACDAVSILERYGLWERYHYHFQETLTASLCIPVLNKTPTNILLADNRTVQQAAAEAANRLGFLVEVLEEPLSGEARIAGEALAHQLCELAGKHAGKNVCLVQGGETTVIVKGDGRGGRNQEFAVSAAQVIETQEQIAIMSFATDGVDGPTDAAGAVVNSEFVRRARSRGYEIQAHLMHNNVYPLLDRMGALVRTGPTWTNLNDLAVGFGYSNC
jgi:hydroxypyruvate reductase